MSRVLTALLRAALFCLTLGSAGAQCVITQAQLDMPEYSALRDSTGTLAVRIECASPQEGALLVLEGPGLSAAPDQKLQLTVYTTQSLGRSVTDSAGLLITIEQGLPLLSGLNLSGTQTLRFPLTALAGQWVPVGTYTLPLSLSLRPPLP